MTKHEAFRAPDDEEKRPARGRRRSAVEARRLLLDVAMAMVSVDSGEFPSLERLADKAGVHKMTIYRIFGSHAELGRAVAISLREREDVIWRETADRCRNSKGCRVGALFRILSEQLRGNPESMQQLDFVESRLGAASSVIREAINVRRQALHNFLLECLQDQCDSIALADALLLLWEGASIPSRSEKERKQLAEVLPTIVDRIMAGPMQLTSASPKICRATHREHKP